MLDAHGVDFRRAAMLRFGLYGSFVGLLTGLGLFFQVGVRDASTWVWFVGGALAGAAGLAWIARSALHSFTESARPEAQEPGVPGPEASVESVQPDLTSGGEVATEADEVDYLTALRHEFRTPLNAVLGFSDVLLSEIDGAVNESQREDLEIIRASGIRLKVLLDSALDLSQLAESQLRLNAESTDVRELVARVAVEAGRLWSNKRTASCTVPEDPCITEADENRLRRSILVLADFLATDHRDSDIALRLARSGEYLSIDITAGPSDRLSLDALPTTVEVLASEDAAEIRRWPVAVTAEVISCHDGSLYHGDTPSRFLIRLPVRGPR